MKDGAEEFKSGSQVILLRHAESKSNQLKSQIRSIKHTKEDILRARTNLKYIDPSITELGKQQCEATAEVTDKLKVEIVLVSPMTRTMQTAYNVFKSHPNFNNIEFIVVPKLKEILSSVSSIPKDITKTIENFKSKFPNLNVTWLEDYNDLHNYYLEDIEDDFAKMIMSEKTAGSDDPRDSNCLDLLVEHIQNWFPRRPESYRSLLRRVSKIKKYIHSLLQSRFNGGSPKMLSDDSKIVVVTHGILGKIWTGKWDRPIDEYDEVPMPSKCKDLKNCELYADNKNFPWSSAR
jgi:broad specificity phosphatase PhoE